jgi:hypothetical protein
LFDTPTLVLGKEAIGNVLRERSGLRHKCLQINSNSVTNCSVD